MNDVWLFFGTLFAVTLLAAIWCVMKELFTRWLNNDWCKHDWGKWKDGLDATDQSLVSQGRWCAKCNKMEKRRL
jgi:hypothetical protein